IANRSFYNKFGLSCYSNSSLNLIQSNSFFGNTNGCSSKSGIRNTFRNNNFYKNKDGIYIYSISRSNFFIKNQIYSNNLDGISLAGTGVNNIQIITNTIF